MQRLAGFLLALVLVLPLALSPRPAAADDARQSAVRSVIDNQIAAFQADDGSRAYSFAAPSIRRIFTSPEMFMNMVRSGYQPVYRPKSVTYGRLRAEGGEILQEVFLVGPDDKAYTALYTLQQQEDGSWKISGCRIALSPGESV
jgi:hypothetical protein